MVKPSFQEIAAFQDLTKEQQKAYLADHPNSKFHTNVATNPKQANDHRIARSIMEDAVDKADLHYATFEHHMAKHDAAKEAGDSVAAKKYLKRADNSLLGHNTWSNVFHDTIKRPDAKEVEQDPTTVAKKKHLLDRHSSMQKAFDLSKKK